MLKRVQRVGADLLPSTQGALAVGDPWGAVAQSVPGRDSFDTRLSALLLKKDAKAAFHMFERGPSRIKPQLLSRLLAIIPSGAETAHIWFTRAMSVAERLGSHAKPFDYAVLLNIAARANKRHTVDRLWDSMHEIGVPRDTNTWNQYIQATCDADPRFWPWPRVRGSSFSMKIANRRARAISAHLEPDMRNDITSLLELMAVEDVAPNGRTYELLLLSLARSGLMSTACSLIERVWMNGSTAAFEVTDSTILAVVDSFGFNNQIEEGYQLAARMTDLTFASPQFWSRAMRIALSSNAATFDKMWNDYTTRYNLTPTASMYWLLLEFLDSKSQFEKMFALVPDLPTAQLVESCVRRAAMGLANTNRPLDALKYIRDLNSSGVEVPPRVLMAIEAKGVSLEQLRLFEEDDDEDNVVGM